MKVQDFFFCHMTLPLPEQPSFTVGYILPSSGLVDKYSSIYLSIYFIYPSILFFCQLKIFDINYLPEVPPEILSKYSNI